MVKLILKKAYVTVFDDEDNSLDLIYKKELDLDVIKLLGIITSYNCNVIDIYGKYVDWSIKLKENEV